MNHAGREINDHGDLVGELAKSFGDTASADAMSDKYDLVMRREVGQEREEREIVMVGVKDCVRVSEADSSSGEINGGGFETGGDKKSDEFIPTPTSVAGSMNKHKVDYRVTTTVSSSHLSLYTFLLIRLIHTIFNF